MQAMSDKESRTEEFKRVTGATMRAISRKQELTVSFAPGQHGLFGGEAKLPLTITTTGGAGLSDAAATATPVAP